MKLRDGFLGGGEADKVGAALAWHDVRTRSFLPASRGGYFMASILLDVERDLIGFGLFRRADSRPDCITDRHLIKLFQKYPSATAFSVELKTVAREKSRTTT